VTAAVDGEDGFKKLKAGTFKAVVSDVQMPHLDGLGLTARIRQFREYQDLPVILVTTLASEEDKHQGTQAGANAYITKGDFEQGILLDTLRRLI
jgi:two-component system chemotaxis sensor kinase CheA